MFRMSHVKSMEGVACSNTGESPCCRWTSSNSVEQTRYHGLVLSFLVWCCVQAGSSSSPRQVSFHFLVCRRQRMEMSSEPALKRYYY